MAKRETADQVIAGLVEHSRELGKLVQPGDGEYHLRTLLAVRDWAYDQQANQVGDRVRIVKEIDFEFAHGWRGWTDHLQRGATGTVEEIGYNGTHHYWYATVRIDTADSLFSFHQDALEKFGEAQVKCPVSRGPP